MDLNFKTDFGNATATELNTTLSSFSVLPTKITDDNEHESLFRLVEKIKTIGITGLFEKLTPNSKNCVIGYILMFIIGAPGNIYVVFSVGYELWKRRFKRSSRIKLLIWHLAVADLFVTVVVIPIEIFWRLTFNWYGGNMLCKSIHFVRTFGIYLSSMIIICISMDRFCAIVFPLKSLGGMRRIHKMLFAAWTFAIIFASPQFVVFSAQKNPLDPSFRVCTNSNYFSTFNMELLYNMFSLVIIYFAPLIVIIVTYTIVFCTISNKSREQQQQHTNHGRSHLRQNGNATQFTKARRNAMWISLMIVAVFMICWTPYVVLKLWYILDFETAERMVDPRVREVLFVTALSNSCLNPIIYGKYMRICFRCKLLSSCPQVFGDYTITHTSLPSPGTSHPLNVMNNSVGLVGSGRRITNNSHQ